MGRRLGRRDEPGDGLREKHSSGTNNKTRRIHEVAGAKRGNVSGDDAKAKDKGNCGNAKVTFCAREYCLSLVVSFNR